VLGGVYWDHRGDEGIQRGGATIPIGIFVAVNLDDEGPLESILVSASALVALALLFEFGWATRPFHPATVSHSSPSLAPS
jgi:hypothetical protein